MRSLKSILNWDRESYVLPRSVHDYIPVSAVWEDGVFRCGNRYTKSWKFSDINYLTADRDGRESMFLRYAELLNSLDSGAVTKITVNNRRRDRTDFEKQILLPEKDDSLREYRREYNAMLTGKATGENGIVQEKYLTVSVIKKDIGEARSYFSMIGAGLENHFSKLGSRCSGMDAEERLRVLRDFYRAGEEDEPFFGLSDLMRRGHDPKDYIAPDSFERFDDYLRIGNRYARVLFLKEYASYIRDSLVSELTGLNRNMMLSVDITPVPTEEAVKEAEKRLLGIDTNITNWQKKQNGNANYTAAVPYDMEQQRRETTEFIKDLTERDQRMMFATITLVHTADTKEQLDLDTESLLTTARKHLCQLAVLRYQQMDGLNTVLPVGVRKVKVVRTLTTESLAVFMPFRNREICHPGGIYCGQNAVSGNMILVNRSQLMNGNAFILGVSGSGKSFLSKSEIAALMMSGDSDIIIIDPEREYSPLIRAMGGTIVDISAASRNHINAMDLCREYGDGEDPAALKSEFILSLCEQLAGSHTLGPKEKSLIDRCTANVYRNFRRKDYTGNPPTLKDFRTELMKQEEPEAKDLALTLELFTEGSLSTFAKKTNVDVGNRLLCYDIRDLGKQLLPTGMLVVLDSILNRITANRDSGKNTYIFIDEIYLLFQHPYSAAFLETLWKRVRKYGAFCTGITQNVDDLLQSHTARTMLANSEFVIMLNQAATDRIRLAELLNISDTQLEHISNADTGCGLMKVGPALIPFVNRFPRDTALYRLMTTKFSDVSELRRDPR